MSLATNGIPTKKELKELQTKNEKTRKERLGNPQPSQSKQDTGWIQTHSGIKFFPFDPKIEDINISDIAWSLSHINRFLGHSRTPISVAQHSIFGAWIMWQTTKDKQLALWFLLHDASEAYLGDLIKPFKVLPQFAFYKEAESILQDNILRRFGLSEYYDQGWPNPEIIKDTDNLMLYLEVEELRKPIHPDNAFMPGSAEHLALKEKLGWKDEYLKSFYELLEKNSKAIYQIFLADFAKYNRE